MNTIDNPTMIALIACSTIIIICVLCMLIFVAMRLRENHWKHYYRGLQKQISTEGDTLVKFLIKNKSMNGEVLWFKRQMDSMAKNRTLPHDEAKMNSLELHQSIDCYERRKG